MKNSILVLALNFASSATVLAQARYVTLKLDTNPPNPLPQTNEVVIAPYEVAELVSCPNPYNQFEINVVKDGTTFSFGPSDIANTRGVVMAGPAVIKFGTGTTGQKGFCTFRITPESFPPDKTLIIPDGTAGATVTLECSTNLINWGSATNGFYSGTNSAKFFRIRAERAQ